MSKPGPPWRNNKVEQGRFIQAGAILHGLEAELGEGWAGWKGWVPWPAASLRDRNVHFKEDDFVHDVCWLDCFLLTLEAIIQCLTPDLSSGMPLCYLSYAFMIC